MNWDQILAAISLIAVLILVIPAFLKTNSKLKPFLKNLSIWTIIIILLILIINLIFK